jgi:hypothetical protein
MSGFALSPQTYLREPMANLLSRIALFRGIYQRSATARHYSRRWAKRCVCECVSQRVGHSASATARTK